MSKYYIKKKTVLFHDVDLTGKLNLKSLIKIILEASSEHCSILGFSNNDLAKKNLTWVIARTKLEIVDLPVSDEEIIIKTWPGKTKKILYPRYATIESLDGKVYVKSIIVWSVFDLTNRSISFADLSKYGYPNNEDVEECLLFPSKLEIQEAPNKKKYNPQYHDFDRNNHVNNIQYVEWILDILGKDYMSKHILKSCQIDYHTELLDDNEVSIETCVDNNHVYAHIVREDRVMAVCTLDFTEI